MTQLNRLRALGTMWLALGFLGGCAQMSKPQPAAVPAAAPASTPTVVEAPPPAPVITSETVLEQGIKAYQSAQYQQAELDLKSALQMGLSQPADIASANKYLAFIYCTSKRQAMCLAAFKAARAADPKFALSKAEAGHPMWGPVYKRSLKESRR
ncbi:MAG TPA: TssQ family T6SS-associated lipoprotein [Aquabacterium sp.]|nr:TssQ family T6SS-associated lipoprotein [Aquabacterium sp.]